MTRIGTANQIDGGETYAKTEEFTSYEGTKSMVSLGCNGPRGGDRELGLIDPEEAIEYANEIILAAVEAIKQNAAREALNPPKRKIRSKAS